MCHFCPHASRHARSPWVKGAETCTVSGSPVVVHATIHRCPVGRFNPHDDHTRWLGLVWYGVPYPLRVLLRRLHPSRRAVSYWAGCGCIKPLKDFTVRVGERLWRRTHENPV